MNINVKKSGSVTIVELAGTLDSNTTEAVEQHIIPLIEPDCQILLDMEKVYYMSSAGLRLLLLLSRNISENKGKVILTGISERLKDIMSMTGFLNFFTYFETVNEGLEGFNQH